MRYGISILPISAILRLDFGKCSDSVICFVFHFICTFCFAVFCCCWCCLLCYVLFVFWFLLFFSFFFCFCFVCLFIFRCLCFFYFIFCCFCLFVCLFFVLFFCLLCFLCGYFEANIRQLANNDRLKQVEDFIRRTFSLIDFLLHFRRKSLLKHVFILYLYKHCSWGSNYQYEGWDPIICNRFDPATFILCLSQIRTIGIYVVVFFVENQLNIYIVQRNDDHFLLKKTHVFN